MTQSFDDFKRQILNHSPNDDEWTDEELEMLDFLASPDDQGDVEVGTEDFLDCHVSENVLRKLHDLQDENENDTAASDTLLQTIACKALGYQSIDQLTPLQRHDLYIYIAETRKTMLHALAQESLASKPEMSPETMTTVYTTMLLSERTTVLMARTKPAWVLQRESRYANLAKLDPKGAKVYLLGEYGNCEPALIAEVLAVEPDDSLWSEQRAATELAAARAFCMM